MKCTLSNIVMFAAGAVIGSAVTWKVLKTKYERLAQEEIDSVKEAFSRRKNAKENVVADIETADADHSKEYASILSDKGYAHDIDPDKIEKGGTKPVDEGRPYVIAPEEFGEDEDFETISLTYYADGILTDDMDKPMSDDLIEELIGRESLDHFGEYEDDSVFVRNEIRKTDYEILRDMKKYPGFRKTSYPHLMDDDE